MGISISHIRWAPWALDNNTNNACMHTHTHTHAHTQTYWGRGSGEGVDMTVKDSFESVTEQVSPEGGSEQGKHMELIISDICLICMHVYIIMIMLLCAY